MCLLITAFSGLLCFYLQKKFFFDLKRLCIMFSSAAVMWTVDCTFAKIDGESFFDISADDTLLGITVVFCALIHDVILRLPQIVNQTKISSN